MKNPQSEATTIDKKLKLSKLYQILMVCFLALAVLSSGIAIFIGVQFHNYKQVIVGGGKISLVLETRKMNDGLEIPKDYQIEVERYGGSWLAADWKGKSLGDFLLYKPELFSVDKLAFGLFLKGILGSETDSDFANKYWMVFSPTDPGSVAKPNEPTNVGISELFLRDTNVFYFGLFQANFKFG